MNAVNGTQKTASGNSVTHDAAGAARAVQLKGQLRDLQFFDRQAAALAPRESSTAPRASDAPAGTATNDPSAATTDDFAALLAKVIADPAKLCDQAFIDALTAKKGVLDADESDKLVTIFRGVTATQRAKLVGAIGAAPMEKFREESRSIESGRFTVQEYEKAHPGERVTTPPIQDKRSPTLDGRLPGKITVRVGFEDLEHEAIFAELLNLPQAHARTRRSCADSSRARTNPASTRTTTRPSKTRRRARWSSRSPGRSPSRPRTPTSRERTRTTAKGARRPSSGARHATRSDTPSITRNMRAT